ncbi:MAG: S8 family serine peptidase [Promethearchaeota archaeon]
MKINRIILILLIALTFPFLTLSQVLNNMTNWTLSDSPKSPYLQDESGLVELSDQNQALKEEKTTSFLKEVIKRLNSGEDPETPVDVFVYWDARQPDFPEWIEVTHTFNLIPVIQVRCKLGEVSEVAELRHVTKVAEVSRGTHRAPSSVEYLSDPYVGEYPLLLNETRSLVDANDNSTTGSGVIVAILSTGINETHPMLDDQDDDYDTTDPKIIDSFDAHQYMHGGPQETIDYIGWGTALASIVTGTACCGGQFASSITFQYPYPYLGVLPYDSQNVTGIIQVGDQLGIAPAASLLDVKITSTLTTTFTESSMIAGIEWAAEHGADVILLDVDSITGTTVIPAIEAATRLGALVVVPAGDYDPSTITYDDDTIAPYYTIGSPASAPSALTVGATTETDALWLESARGPVPGSEISKPDVVAPGVHLLAANHEFADNEASTGWEGDPGSETDTLYYRTYSSTAVAAAVSAGVSARLIQSYPGASPTAIKIALRKGAVNLGFNEMAQGKGRISLSNAENILASAANQSNYYVGDYFSYSDPASSVTYADFTGKRILFDGSHSNEIIGASTYDWSDQTNGNLSTLGVPGWQHPYNDAVAGYYWYNISFPGSVLTDIYITNLTIAQNDNFSLFSSPTPNDPNPTPLGAGTWNINTTAIPTLSTSDEYLYFRYGADGDGFATGESVFGIYGYIELSFHTSAAIPSQVNFEFYELATQLETLGADVEYWYSASAQAPPTATILEYYDIFVIGQPVAAQNYVTLSLPSETSYYDWLGGNLTNYVNNGGKLLFIGDAEASYYDAATSGFDVYWHQGGVGGPTTNFAIHDLLTSPFTIEEILIDAPYAYFSGSSQTIVYDGNVPTVVHYQSGGGQAIFVADEDVFNDELWVDPYDITLPHEHNNSRFAMNIFYGLCEVSYQSGPRIGNEEFQLVSYNCHKLMTDGDPWELNVTLENVGNFTSAAMVAFGMDWTPQFVDLNITMTAPGDDNANDTWGPVGDGDFDTFVNGTTIEFFYNISDTFPVDQIVLPYIDFDAYGVDRQTDECFLYVNNNPIGPIYETNTTPINSGDLYYAIDPNDLKQFNNEIAIDVPSSISLRIDNFVIRAYNMTSGLGQIQHVQTPLLAPHEQTTRTFTFTPVINDIGIFEPKILWMPANLTHAWVSPGFGVGTQTLDIYVDYGTDVPTYYDETGSQIFGINKRARRGDLPLLYDITPAFLTSSSSTKIVQFPGDLRVDGLTIMSSIPIDSPRLQVTGSIATIVGLGNLAESATGLGDYADPTIAPNYFYYNHTWASTSSLPLDAFNHTFTGAILQTYLPPIISAGVYSGLLTIYSGNSEIYSISLRLTVEEPTASFLLYDLAATDDIDDNRNYDKLWDQVFEIWKIASELRYDIDSLYQEAYLYELETHKSTTTTEFLDQHVNVPCGEELPYAAILGIGMDASSGDTNIDDFLKYGGSLVQFGADFHLGPRFNADIDYFNHNFPMLTVIDGSESTHPLLSGVDHLLYTGGGYLIVDQQDYLEQLTYDVISGLNWISGNLSQELALIYHDPIYPYQFCYDSGKYSPDVLKQTNNGTKIIIGTDILAQSWFLEQVDVWGYFSLQLAVQAKLIPKGFDITLNNRQFIENVLHAAGNKAPTIESIEVTPEHVAPGEKVTIRVNVTDDQTSELTVLCPENLENDSLYVPLTYNSTRDEYSGSFRVVDINRIHDWNIIIFDDLYRASWALDPCKSHFIPRLNVKPLAWTTPIFRTPNNEYEVYDFYIIEGVKKGNFLSIPVYFEDREDGVAVDCNVSLVYYENAEKSRIVVTTIFSGTGFGMFLVDTTDFNDGSYLVVATVTDTDGGTGFYLLAGFNIGQGTLFKKPEERGIPWIPVIGGLGTLAIIGAAGAGGYYYYYYRRKVPSEDF